ncbi:MULTISPECIES: glycosyltransferase family 2 protein [Flavobacterium]|uniref:glycosyltransferase family 2 protein n=1 Tax=Flavobacterium TaxID=237 RepID=UPI001182DCC9|nr:MULTISPECIES: glycosyltransferase [Flavobacterium]MCR4030941.1 glycosyltransferase family 2 protein [Flavobacterium panacis]
MPKVSVLMPVYNCELYIKDAIESILNQTFVDFELIIIDDCSTDLTLSIIKSYFDSRIKLIEKAQNTGYTNSLNYAISIATGDYIARMDGDDIAFPDRFQKQYDFLNQNQDVVICGTAMQIIGNKQIVRHPSDHNNLKIRLCFGSVFHHPTVMIKTHILKENIYNKDYEPAEDYELWTRLAFIGKMANLEEVLLQYRIHSGQTSAVRKNLQDQNIFRCQMHMLNKFFVEDKFTATQIKTALKIESVQSKKDISDSLKLYYYLKEVNKKVLIFEEDTFKNVLKNKELFLFQNYLKNNSNTLEAAGFIIKNKGFSYFVKVVSPIKKLKKVIKKIIRRNE